MTMSEDAIEQGDVDYLAVEKITPTPEVCALVERDCPDSSDAEKHWLAQVQTLVNERNRQRQAKKV
jgi:hypothetical protein